MESALGVDIDVARLPCDHAGLDVQCHTEHFLCCVWEVHQCCGAVAFGSVRRQPGGLLMCSRYLHAPSEVQHPAGLTLRAPSAAQGKAEEALEPLRAAREVLQTSLGTDFEAVGEAQFYSALAKLHMTDRSNVEAVAAFDADLLKVSAPAILPPWLNSVPLMLTC